MPRRSTRSPPPEGWAAEGAFIGRDVSGGAFCFDPWVLYGDGALDDPNVIVLGKLGQGKSALVKTLLWRMLLFGRRAFVLDVKREYGPLCDAAGVRPISLVPGRRRALNPLAVATRGARPGRAAARGRHHRDRRTASPGRGGALREALRTSAPRSRRADAARDRRAPVRPARRMARAGCARRPEQLARRRPAAALALQDLCEGPLQGCSTDPPPRARP